jgi:hypothetical protein
LLSADSAGLCAPSRRQPAFVGKTVSAYLRAPGIAVRPAGKWERAPPNPAKEVTADSEEELAQSEKSLAAPFREFIEEQLGRGLNAFGIYQPLVDSNGFTASYESVKRFVRALKKSAQPQVARDHPG